MTNDQEFLKNLIAYIKSEVRAKSNGRMGDLQVELSNSEVKIILDALNLLLEKH